MDLASSSATNLFVVGLGVAWLGFTARIGWELAGKLIARLTS